ncbi:MAG TPA: phosphohistidine phosphatase SixA [Candidatus Binataceae bacterium]|nr:phosphohistidine phosphatase SixA [Candidatus Binataceae bacterium]
MMLYILRHATAEETSPTGSDGARRLPSDSKDKMRDAARGMLAMGVEFDLILTSPLVRAAETAEIVAAAYGNNPAPQVMPQLGSGAPASEVVSELRAFSKFDNVLIVGHEPQLSAIASIVLSGSSDAVKLKLKTGGCIAIDLPARFERGGGELRWMLTQRQLRKMRK